MNSFVLSVDHLISNFTRPVVVWQVVVLLLALWAWFWVSRRLGLEGRSWPLTRRYPCCLGCGRSPMSSCCLGF